MQGAPAAGSRPGTPPASRPRPGRSRCRRDPRCASASMAWPAIAETLFSSGPGLGVRRPSTPAIAPSRTSESKRCTASVVAGEVGARGRLRAVLGGQVAQHAAGGRPARPRRPTRGQRLAVRRPTRRVRRHRSSRARSRRLEVVVPALGVQPSPAPRSRPSWIERHPRAAVDRLDGDGHRRGVRGEVGARPPSPSRRRPAGRARPRGRCPRRRGRGSRSSGRCRRPAGPRPPRRSASVAAARAR